MEILRRIVFGVALFSLPVGAFPPISAAAATGQIIVKVTTNTPLAPIANARVYVYLERHGASSTSYVDQLIATGATDNTGEFGFDLSTIPAATQEAATTADNSVGLNVYVVSFSSRRYGSGSDVVPIMEPRTINVVADSSFLASALQPGSTTQSTTATCVEAPDPDGGDPAAPLLEQDPDWNYPQDGASLGNPCATEGPGVTGGLPTRWVKITHQHVATGFNSRFCYLAGKNTRAETVIREKIAGSWGAWEVGAWAMEARARSSEAGSCSPSTADGDGAPGPMHKTRMAKYQKKRYDDSHLVCDPGGGGCLRIDTQKWRLYSWTGGLKFKQGSVSQPSRDVDKSVRIPSGDDFWKNSQRNTEFGSGLSFLGFELNSMSGYSTITKLWWYSRPRCNANYLAGKYNYPVPTHAEIFSYSTGC